MPVGTLERTVQVTPTKTGSLTAPIRERYPNPTESSNWRPGDERYCVGGAFMFWLGDDEWHGFPGPDWLASGLMKANPRLPDAKSWAWAIIAPNDHGDFERAWQVLENALAWGREEVHGPQEK